MKQDFYEIAKLDIEDIKGKLKSQASFIEKSEGYEAKMKYIIGITSQLSSYVDDLKEEIEEELIDENIKSYSNETKIRL